MSGRSVGVVTTMLLAPVTAELLQAYLDDLGGPLGLVFVVLFFAPLYGGAALLIRELAVRTGRGWSGRLLLAAGFGVSMTTIIDVSLFTTGRDDIDDWELIAGAASVAGIGVFAAVAWVAGHVLMSVAAPLVVAESLARDPRPWLRRIWLPVIGVAFVLIAVAIHQDQVSSNVVEAGPRRYVASAAVVGALVGLAFTRVGRPLPRRSGSVPRPAACVAAGAAGMVVFDLAPPSWAGVALAAVLLVAGGALVAHWSRSTAWTQRHLAALTWGALLARTGVGFLAPLPQDTTWTEKITQNLVYLALILLLGWAMSRRTRSPVGVG